MDNRGLGIGSLYRWCKEDNLKEYKKIIKEDLDSLIRISLNETDYDIEKLYIECINMILFVHQLKLINGICLKIIDGFLAICC